MSLSSALTALDLAILNGDEARPSPLAGVAKTVKLGTRLNELAALASKSNGEGASLVGVEDAASSLVATNVEAALAELALPLTLTPAAEVADVIKVAVQGPAHAAQYVAELWTDAAIQALAAAFTLAETGAGAEVSTTAQARLIFTTSALGVAELSITDVAGASGDTLYLVVKPLATSGGLKPAVETAVAVSFD